MGLLVVFLGIIALNFAYRYFKLRSEVDEFSDIINQAIDGKLSKQEFDEREISKLKSKLSKFLYSNQVREEN